MKRRTKQNIGAWPNMRDYTLKQISEELLRARKRHPNPGDHVVLLESYVTELESALRQHKMGRMTYAQVFALACSVAALSIRVAEEGSTPFATYPQASANMVMSAFELTGGDD